MGNLMFLDICSKEAETCVGIVTKLNEKGEEVAAGLPGNFALLVHYGYLMLQVAVPIVLIIIGMISFAKAITAQKEDEINAAKRSFIKKVIIAVVIFLVFTIVELLFDMLGGSGDIWQCVNQLIDGECGSITTSS